MSNVENERAVVGDNQAPEYARRITEQMQRDYKSYFDNITALLDTARQQPTKVDSDATATAVGLVIKNIREADRQGEAYRVAEKEPHKAAADAIDAIFFAAREKLARRNSRDRSLKPGAADILQARVDEYLERKRVEEENRRQREAQEAARVAREAQEKALRDAREAEELAQAAARARKPENVAARTEEAAKAAEIADAASVEAAIATEQAQDARLATMAKPADMSRTRGFGVLLTQARESYAIMVDRTKLDWSKLAPFFTDAEVEKALRAWAKITNHVQNMDGAEIGFRRKGVTR